GVPELLIILAVILLLFGGTKLAGLGKSTGRALREFKEETKGLTEKEAEAKAQAAAEAGHRDEPIDAELVQPEPTNDQIKRTSAEPRRDA
ncbi:MAG: twin-arginine translocase TatA/TatE family subunit, partial [Propionibacteriaceae bacterium]